MSTSSFKIKGRDRENNYPCFAPLRAENCPDAVIFINKKKFYKSLKLTLEYFDDLKSIGYDFTYKYDKRREEYIVDVSKIKGYFKRVSFFMIIRFLWEGRYKPLAYGSDNFVVILDHYFMLKELFPNEKNKLVLLCIATNCFITADYVYNANHMLSGVLGCKILKNLDSPYQPNSVNESFYKVWNLKKDKELQGKEWSKEQYIKLFKKVEYEYPE